MDTDFNIHQLNDKRGVEIHGTSMTDKIILQCTQIN